MNRVLTMFFGGFYGFYIVHTDLTYWTQMINNVGHNTQVFSKMYKKIMENFSNM